MVRFGLQRDLSQERARVDEVIERFSLSRLSADGLHHWVAESDEIALDLLGSLYSGGDQTPRIIWPEGESIRVRGEITPSALRVQIDDRRDWFGLTGSISLDGREIPLAELLAAVRDHRALVQVGDRQFAKISDAFRKRLQQLGDAVVAERGTLKVADAAVPAVQELISTDVPLEATARWHESLRRLESLADWTPQQPKELDATLRDYQLEGFQWLARLSAWGVGGVLGRRHGARQDGSDSGRSSGTGCRRTRAGGGAYQRRGKLAARDRAIFAFAQRLSLSRLRPRGIDRSGRTGRPCDCQLPTTAARRQTLCVANLADIGSR